MVNEITIRKGESSFSEGGTVRIRLLATLRQPTNIAINAPVKMRVSDQEGARLLKTVNRTFTFNPNGTRQLSLDYITNIDTNENQVFALFTSDFASNNLNVVLTRTITPPIPPPPIVEQSVSFEIKFVDLPNENFSSNVNEADWERLRQEATLNGRWSTRLLARVDSPAQFTFEQVIRTIDDILAKPLPPDGCGQGFHRDQNGLCVPDDDLPIDEERNLFQSAIIGVLALGALGGSLLDDKPKKRRKR